MIRNRRISIFFKLKTYQYSISTLAALVFLLAAPTVASAQAPVVNAGGVVNAASFTTTVVAGSEASIFGNNLAASTGNFGGVQPVPTTLNGASVSVGGYAAHLYATSPGQLNIQIPWELAGQASAQLTVTTANGTSNAVTINLAQYAPALFGSIFNPNGNQNSSTNAANPGSIVVITATNLGPAQIQQIDGQAPNGNLVPIANAVSVTIGGSPATVVLAELCGGAQYCPAPNSAYLIYVQVPNVSGPTLPVVLTEGAIPSNAVTMNVAAQALTINSGPNFGDFQLGTVQIPLQASGGAGGPYTWSLANGSALLPNALAVRNDGGPNYFPVGITSGILGVATTPGTTNFTLQVTDSASNSTTLACSLTILSLAITNPSQLSDGLKGAAYSYTMTATGATGNVTWSAPNNNLPAGLSINSNTGVISGSPTNPGNYGFNISAQDSTGTTTLFYNMQIFGVGFATDGDLGIYNQGSAVDITLTGAGGTPPYSFSAGGLPQGLSLNSNTGVISGTIASGNGSYRFSGNITDHNGFNYNKNFVLNIVSVPTPPNLNYANPIEYVTLGESRNFPLNINGGTPPYHWTISNGTLPPGMALLTGNQPSGNQLPSNFGVGPNDAVITGVPTAAPPGNGSQQAYTFTVNVTDSSATPFTVSQPITLTVTILDINYPSNPIRGVPYSGYIQPIGGVNRVYQGAVNWTILDGILPPGLTLSPNSSISTTPNSGGGGYITGTPTTNGNYTVFIDVNCCAGLDHVQRYVTFNALSPTTPPISFNNVPSLPDGTVNGNYNANVNACCAPNGLTFSVVGSLPAGLNLNSNGQLSGTPTAAGSYNVEIKATDNNNSNNFGIAIYTLNVTPFQVSTPTPLATVGVAYTTSFSVTSGNSGPVSWSALGQGSQLPPGLNWSNGTLSGTPASAGSFNMNTVVSDTGGNSFHIGFTVNVYPAASIPPPTFNFGSNFGTWLLGEAQFALNAGGGNGTYSWSVVSGSLPPGLAIRTDPPFPSYFNGAVAGISGVATTPGNYAFTLALTSGGVTSYQYCTWRITSLNVMDSGSLPPAFIGVPYSYTFTVLNAPGAVTFTQNNGNMAPGLSLSSSGTISGTPTQAGNFNFGYLVNDGADTIGRGTNISVSTVRFNNTPGQSGFMTSAILNNVTTNTAVNATFNAAGGSGGYTYSPNGLPCCLSLSSGGVLSGTLNGVGNFGFQVTVTDSQSHSYSQEFSIDAIGIPPLLPAINLGPLAQDPVSSVGGYISSVVSVGSGGVAPFTWTVTGLPPGVSYRPYTTSELTYMVPGQIEIWGVPTSVGTYSVTYQVTDVNGLSASLTSTMTISSIMVDYSNYPPNGTVGVAYSDKIRVLGGTGPYSISQLYPTYYLLPDGLTLNTGTFTISGTPLEDGNFSPDFKVSDSQGNSYVMLTGFNIGTSTSPQITINGNSFLGNITLNTSYNFQLSSCCANSGQYTYSLASGNLPPGITLSPSGKLSGTATAAGAYVFLVKSADSTNLTNAGYKELGLLVTPITLTGSATLPYGNVGTLYNYAIPYSGNTGAVSFQLGPGSLLPPGVTFSSGGVLNGTPTAAGQFQFNAILSDTGGNYLVANFNVSIYAPGSGLGVVINTGANLGTVSIGVVQIALSASAGNGAYTWSLAGGSLPPGLSLRTDLPTFFSQSASAGIIGVATAASATPYSFTLRVTSGTQSTTQTFMLKVTGLTLMENYGFRLPDAFVGSGYSAYTLTPLNNAGAVTFSQFNNVPPGMTLSSAGVLSGTPTTSGFYNFNFSVNDTVNTVGLSASINVTLVQVTSPALLTNATQNAAYTPYTFTASGGTGPYTFSANGLPNGMTVSAAGVLSGTPTGIGRFFLNVTATDSSNHSGTKAIALVVVGVPPALPFINPYGNLDDCSYGMACSRGLAVQNGGTAPFAWTITGLPPGMNYRTASSVLSYNIVATDVELWGAPLATGNFSVTAVVTDSSVPPVSATETFTLHVSPLWPDGSYSLPNGTIGVAYSRQLRVLGGTPAASNPLYNVQVSPLELPAGLTLNGMSVSGTPGENGNFSPDFAYTDNANPQNTLHNTWYFNIADSGTNTNSANTYSFGNPAGTTTDIIGYYARGSSINFQLNACCVSPYTWTQTGGTLPTGVTLSASGLLSGTISNTATIGPNTFTVRVANGTNTGARQYTIYISSYSYTSNSLPYGVLNQAYSQQIPLTNSVTGTFSLLQGSYLPPGIALSSGGLLSGTPTVTGQYTFWISSANTGNANDVYVTQFNLSVWTAYPPLFLGTGPTIGPFGPGGANTQLTASGGVPPYTYSVSPGFNLPLNYRIQNGGQLPEGFTLSSGTGGLIGIVEPATAGTYPTSLRVTDSASNTYDRPVTMILTSMTIPNTNNPPAAYQGTAYSYTFAGTGGSPPYTGSVSGLPAGITLSGSTISGTPTASGSFSLTVTIKDTTGTALNFSYTLNVYPFNITTGQVLPLGTVGVAYSQQLSAPNCASCSWFAPNGGLPGGLSLNSGTGVISGTPGNTYNGSFLVQAKSGNNTALKAFAIQVQQNTPQPLYITNNPNLYTAPIGNGYTTGLFAQGGTPPYTWSVSAGSLPPGVSLVSPGETVGFEFTPGVTYLVGRPSQLGNYSFTLKVTDSASNTATQAFTWAITPMTINTTLLPAKGSSTTYAGTPNPMPIPTYGVAYSQQIEVIGGTGVYTSWLTPLATNPLPSGLSINQITGVVSGTPTATGSYSTLLQATDSIGDTLEQFVTFNVAAPTSATVNIGIGPNIGTYGSGESWNFYLNPSGGTGPYTFTALTPLPPGCAFQTGNELNGYSNGNYDLACVPLQIGTFTFTLQATDSVGNLGVRVLSITFAPLDLVNSQQLDTGSTSTAYSEDLITFDNSGSVTWSLTPGSALPPGITLNGSVISGTPTTAGNYSFTLTDTDSGTGASITHTFNISVSTINITTPSVIPVQGAYLAPYSYQFTATGGGANKTWSANNLPSGLSMSAGGLISGSPSVTGTFKVSVTVTDGVSSITKNYKLFVYAAQLLTYNPSLGDLPDTTVGEFFGLELVPSGGTAPFTWSVAPGSQLPPGLILVTGSVLPDTSTPGTTYLAGSTSTPGQYTFSLIVTDSAGGSVQAPFTLNVTPLAIQPGNPLNGTISVAYSSQLIAVGGTAPYTYSYSASAISGQVLPPGIGLSSAGLFSGTPTSTGSFQFNVTVTDSALPAHNTFTSSYNITVTNASGLWVTAPPPSSIPAGYGMNIPLTTSGSSTYTWSVSAGSLPAGITLNSSGTLLGAANAAGNYPVTIRATDNANASNFADRKYVFQISPMQLNFALGQPPSGTVGVAYSYQYSMTGGVPPYTFSSTPLYPLPAGLTISSSGLISGTPTQAGSYQIYAMVTDHQGNAGWAIQNGFNIVPQAGQKIPLQGLSIHTHNGTVGGPFMVSTASYSYPLDGAFTAGGMPPISYSVAPGSSLPPGIVLVPGANGVPPYLGGVPTAAGQYNYSLIATDSAGQMATVPVYTVVAPMGATPAVLPNGTVNSAYSATIAASGGTPGYTYSLAKTTDGYGNPAYSGLPPGLQLSAQGVLSGTPNTPGTYNLVIAVEDSAGTPNILVLNYTVVIDSAGTAQGIGITPVNPIKLSYLIGGAGPNSVPVNVTTTSGALSFDAMVSGVPGASLSATSGSAPAALNLNINTTGLSPGTYSGVLGIYAPNAVNEVTGVPVVLTVTSPYPCSVSNGTSSTVVDVQAIINEALGKAPPTNDVNGDGVLNVVDVQIVINAVLSLGCTA